MMIKNEPYKMMKIKNEPISKNEIIKLLIDRITMYGIVQEHTGSYMDMKECINKIIIRYKLPFNLILNDEVDIDDLISQLGKYIGSPKKKSKSTTEEIKVVQYAGSLF